MPDTVAPRKAPQVLIRRPSDAPEVRNSCPAVSSGGLRSRRSVPSAIVATSHGQAFHIDYTPLPVGAIQDGL